MSFVNRPTDVPNSNGHTHTHHDVLVHLFSREKKSVTQPQSTISPDGFVEEQFNPFFKFGVRLDATG